MISCERPGGATRSPYRFSNFTIASLTLDVVGTGVNALFPLAVRLATLDLQTDAAVFTMSLTSSIIAATALDTVGVFVALDRGAQINVGGSSQLFLCHLARQNSVAGLPASSSRTNTIGFGQDSAYKLPTGSKLALYAASSNTAANEISAVLSVYWTPAGSL